MAEPTPSATINLVDERTGEVVNVDERDLPKLGEGYRVASEEEITADLQRQEYGEGFANEAAAFGEGALSGATLGLSDVAAKAISDDYAKGLALRREYNPISAGIGEGAGVLGATLLSGGLGGAAAGGTAAGSAAARGGSLLARGGGALLRGAELATAPTRALVGLGEAATAGAGRLLGTEAATGALGGALREAGAYAAGGATEGALFGAAKAATDDFLNDQEITTERILAGAGTGAFAGAVLGGGLGGGAALAERGAQAVWPALKRAINTESIDDFVAERAYKAALGGRNLKDVQRSERIGGPEEVGRTLLAEGIVTPRSTIEDIAAAAKSKAAERGSRIGELVDEFDRLEAPAARKYAIDEGASSSLVSRLNEDAWARDVAGEGFALGDVPLSQVTTKPVSADAAKAAAQAMEAGTPLPPIRARLADDGKYVIEAGDDLVQASIDRGMTHVPAVVPAGSKPRAATAGLDGKKLWARIEDEVIGKLKASPVKRDVGEAVENRLAYLKEALVREDAPPITFRDLWTLRRDFDDRLRWDQAPTPFAAPNPALESMRDVRRTFEDFWQEAGDSAAKAAGNDALMAEFREAKRSYSHLKHAEEIATKAITRDSANRMLSPSDYGFGAVVAGADAITGGGAGLGSLAYGLASGAVHKFFRERGNAMFAGTMHSLRGAPKLVRDARAGEVAAEAAGRGIVDKLLKRASYTAKRSREAAPAAAATALASPSALETAARTAAELTDPASPRREEMRRVAASVRVEYPALANAMETKAQQVADFLKTKTGPVTSTPSPGDPFGHLRKPRRNPAEAQKLARYVDAATNPRGALERIGTGQIGREDVEVLQTLYPRLYTRVRDEVLQNLSTVDELPSYDARLKLGILLGAPADPSMRPEMVQALQQVARGGAGSNPEQQAAQGMAPGAPPQSQGVGEPVLSPSQRREPKLGKFYATQTQAQSVEGSRQGG